MIEKLSIAVALQTGTHILRENQILTPREDANLLLRHILGRDKTFLIAHDEYILTEIERETFFQLITRRTQNEPLQYLTGKQEFFGLEFAVSPQVLIPRPETEILVATALEILAKKANPKFCEVGIGSGCVAISILKNLPAAMATGLDISLPALRIAEKNAARHLVGERLQLAESDLFKAFFSREAGSPQTNYIFDLIVSNPPYIPEIEAPSLAREVRDFEPPQALFSGADGFNIIRLLLKDAPQFLISNGFLAFEIGFGQAARLREIIDFEIWNLVEIRQDWQKIPRITVLQMR